MMKSRLSLLISLALLLLPMASRASQKDEYTPSRWIPGLHLLGGAGINAGRFLSEDEVDEEGMGVGLHLTTAVVYPLSNDFALDLGTIVNFNRNSDTLFWDTLIVAGLRFRVPYVKYTDELAPYIRVIGGYGPAVGYFDEDSKRYPDFRGKRAHLTGPVAGAGAGILRRTRGTTWFIEGMTTMHFLDHAAVIQSDDVVPFVTAHRYLDDDPHILSIHVAVGILVF